MKPHGWLCRVLLLTSCLSMNSPVVRAQSLGVPIESGSSATPQVLLDQAERLLKDGKLLKSGAIAAQLAAPVPGPVALALARTNSLRPREIAERARAGGVHVGWYYLCLRCDHWHAKLLGGS